MLDVLDGVGRVWLQVGSSHDSRLDLHEEMKNIRDIQNEFAAGKKEPEMEVMLWIGYGGAFLLACMDG